jgi:putative Ca2+/H+ antiporter (TMEM165/GDT1 family)
MFGIASAAYVTVLFAELLGDRSLYTVSSLAMRFRLGHVLLGVTAAFGAKMAVATLAGGAIARLPPTFVTTVSSVTFFVTAFALWRKKPREIESAAAGSGWSRSTSVSFAAIFLTEWADIGQITAAAMVARFGHPLIIWAAATAALVTKGILAIALGAGLQNRISQDTLRYVAITLCLVMGISSMLFAA